MKVLISDDGGDVIGSLETSTDTLWRDLLLYVSRQWETVATRHQGAALEAVLGRSDAA